MRWIKIDANVMMHVVRMGDCDVTSSSWQRCSFGQHGSFTPSSLVSPSKHTLERVGRCYRPIIDGIREWRRQQKSQLSFFGMWCIMFIGSIATNLIPCYYDCFTLSYGNSSQILACWFFVLFFVLIFLSFSLKDWSEVARPWATAQGDSN